MSRGQRRDIAKALDSLEAGGLVVFPTELGYRCGASLAKPISIKRLREKTERADERPFTVAIYSSQDLDELVQIPELAEKLWDVFWPGPLVCLLPVGDNLPELVTSTRKLGIHAPSHPVGRQLLRDSGPLVTTSQNPTVADFRIELRESPLNLMPTVVDLAVSPPRVLESGFISHRELERAAEEKFLLSSESGAPLRFTRFRPEATLIVVVGEPPRIARRLRFLRDHHIRDESVRVLVTDEMAEEFFPETPGVTRLGSRGRLEEVEAQLFLHLGELEKQSSGVVLIGLPSEESQNSAVMDRLEQLAHQVIKTDNPGYSGQAGIGVGG